MSDDTRCLGERVFSSDPRVADIWANKQRQIAGILAFYQTNSLIAPTAGKVTGVLVSGVAIPLGAGARTVPQLARAGAGWGAVEGFLGAHCGSCARQDYRRRGGAVAGAALGMGADYGAPIVARATAL